MCIVKTISQDAYFKKKKYVNKVQNVHNHNIFFYDYDRIESVGYFLQFIKKLFR